MITPYSYQTKGINELAINIKAGIRTQIYQLPTGGGKTVTFGALIQRYKQRYKTKKVVILVHRDELLKQARKSLYNDFELDSIGLSAKVKTISNYDICVGMVETAYNRLKKDPKYFGDNVGLLIIDECHIGNFNKLYDYFKEQLIIGFSATPKAASKKNPLKNYFEAIVTGPQIQDLIDFGSLCPNETYAPKGVNKKAFKVKRGEYDIKQMGEVYSKSLNVQNTVLAYERLCKGLKCLVFNVNVKHSKLVTDAFVAKGYDSKHLDGSESPEARKEILTWFKNTPNAILNNIAVLTTGFNEPSIGAVLLNRSTKSLPLYLQMTGRGSRTYKGKETFKIVDLGSNVFEHNDWSEDIDWKRIFENPEKARESKGAAPIKTCEGCEAIIPVQAVECEFCGHLHEKELIYDQNPIEFEQIMGRINVAQIIAQKKAAGYKEFSAFFEILNKHTTILKYRIGEELSRGFAEKAFNLFLKDVKVFCKYNNRPYGAWIKQFSREQFFKKVKIKN